MSTLIIEPLFNGITFTQPIKVSRSLSVAHIRPWVFLFGELQDGQFQLKVLQGANELLTKTIDYTLINAVKSESYAHGFLRFDLESLILHRNEGEADTEYIFEFSMVNHTTDQNNYLAIVKEWDIKSSIVYGDIKEDGSAINDYLEPAGYEIFEYRGL